MITAMATATRRTRTQYNGNPEAGAGGDAGGGDARDGNTRTGSVDVILLTPPVRRSSCEPASVPAGMVTFTLTSPEESAVTVPNTTGVECRTMVMVSSGV